LHCYRFPQYYFQKVKIMRVINATEINAVSGSARLPTVSTCENSFKVVGGLVGGFAGKYAGGMFGADIGGTAGFAVGSLVGSPAAGAIVGAAAGQKYGKQIGSSAGGKLGQKAGEWIGGKACGDSLPPLESLEGPIGVDGPFGGSRKELLEQEELC